ncbi:MAG: translocation/assembly module TamB domain-containing protein [Bryobacterales bacterium]|nr:translocation/assembly module TamB domain-containing protein [Bryobacterales bacterium]
MRLSGGIWRWAGWLLLGAGLFVVLVVGAGIAVLSSDWAKSRIRTLIEEEITRATGGKAEIASLDYNLRALHFEVGGFALHGTEGPQEAALFRASRIEVDATILSFLGKKVRVDSVKIERPTLHLYLYGDGRTNLPKPPGPSSGRPFTETLIDLGAGRFELRHGIAFVADQEIPLDVRGDNLNLTLDFLRTEDRYRGNVAAQRLQFSTDSIQPVPFDFGAGVSLEREGIRLEDGRLSYGKSEVRFTGKIDQFDNPRIAIPFDGTLLVADFHRPFRLPVEPAGKVTGKGEFRYLDHHWELSGDAQGQGLGIRSGAVSVRDIGIRTRLMLESDSFVFDDVVASVLGGDIRGRATLMRNSLLAVKAKANGLSLDRVSRASGAGPLAFHSKVSGPVEASATIAKGGLRDSTAQAQLTLQATEGENPLSGLVDVSFRERDNTITFRPTRLQLAHSLVTLAGSLREAVDVTVSTTRLQDFLPALAVVSETPETLIPITLGRNGEARFDGQWRGSWVAPALSGDVSGKAISYEGRSVDAVAGHVELDPSHVTVSHLVVRKADAELRGEASVALKEWTLDPQGALSAKLGLKANGMGELLREAAQNDLEITGRPEATLALSGTVNAPEAQLEATLRAGSLYREPFDEITLHGNYARNRASVREATLRCGKATARLTGEYEHQTNNYRSGDGRIQLTLRGWKLDDVAWIRDQKLAAEAGIASDLTAAFKLKDGTPMLSTIDGGIEAADIVFDGKPAGRLSLSAKSTNGEAAVALRGTLAGGTIDGSANIALRDDYPGKATATLDNLSLDAIRPFLPDSLDRRSVPLEATAASSLTVTGSLAKPDQLKGDLTISRLRLATVAPASQTLVKRTSFEIINSRPLRFSWDGKKLTAQDVALEGTGTQLTVAGSLTPGNPRQQLDLHAKGSLNFNIFSAFEPSIDAGGNSNLDLVVRGTFKTPDVYGQLDLNGASFYLAGVPNGLDKINGRIFLYRDRANIEEIRAESGGGSLVLTGFVSYNEGAPAFRVSAHVKDVRVRYPPGVSTSADAELELTGTRHQSILSGNVTITRVALNPRSDLGSILTSTSKPVATPSASQNEFLRNMRFDVQVQTASDVRFDSSLTQDLAGEAALRLRGNPYTPVLLGTVTVNQGEVNFFGNRYFIDRGEISFLNPLKMEPILNLDLRTRVRSIDVTLTFSGPLDKLNINYRSDPPLQLNEIIALLTVGRAPAGSPSLAEAQNEAAQSWQQIGASALVGQAVAAPIAGGLQKFFGVSRIKIDPRLTGVENNPQARVTVEQQVSRDITVTFITNLAGAQQQVVRLEWNFSKDWSMVALRDEEGLFGVDFLLRKRF